MPNYDLHAKYDKIRLQLTFTPDWSRSGGSTKSVSGAFQVSTYWADAFDNLIDGIIMSVHGADGTGTSADGTYASLYVAGYAAISDVTIDPSTLVSGSCELIIDNARFFTYNGGVFVLKVDGMEWWVDGSLEWSGGAKTYTNNTYFAPCGLPLFGVPPTWTPSASVGPLSVEGSVPSGTTPGTIGAECEVTGVGTWMVSEESGDAYVGFPVDIDLPSVASVECVCEAPDLPTLSCTNTSSITVQAYTAELVECVFDRTEQCNPCGDYLEVSPATVSYYDNTLTQTLKSSGITTIPNLEASVRRLDEDNYAAVVLRGGFPETAANTYANCQTAFPVGDVGDLVQESIDYTVHPSLNIAAGVVRAAAHPIEEPFTYTCSSPCHKDASQYIATAEDSVLVVPGPCSLVIGTSAYPPCGEAAPTTCKYDHGTRFLPAIESRISNNDPWEAFYHESAISYYINTWGARNWHFYYLFPPNTSEEGQNDWKVDADTTPVIYWLYKGDQWEDHSLLPSGDETQRRTTLISAPLIHGCQGVWIQNMVVGVETSWWGDATFRVDEPEPPSSKTYTSASEPLWELDDCTAVFGSDITITPGAGHTSIVATLNLGSYTEELYQFPHICDRFGLDWSGSNISAVSVYLVSIDGTNQLLATTTGTHTRPLGVDAKYAGSWKQVFDSSGVTTDEGADTRPEGMSSTIMGDTERVSAFGFVQGRMAAGLKFVFTLGNDTDPITLGYPVCYSVADASRTFQENKSNSVTIWPEGPAVRFGNTQYYYSSAHQKTPRVRPPGYSSGMKPSIIDAMSWRNNFLLGKAYDDGVSAEIAAKFESEEGTTVADINTFSVAYLIPESQ